MLLDQMILREKRTTEYCYLAQERLILYVTCDKARELLAAGHFSIARNYQV